MSEYQESDRSGLIDRIKWSFKFEGTHPEGCPHCGCDEFYRKLTFSGESECNYRFDGNSTYNGQLHDGVIYHERKTVYCRNCDKKLGVEREVDG